MLSSVAQDNFTDPGSNSVVLVHGLDGDPIETWEHITTGTKPQRRTVWPEKLLPKILPRVRVLSFGYNGDMYRSNSVAGIRGNAGALLSHLKSLRYGVDQTRPIVFVAHCLGGLIVKQASPIFSSHCPAPRFEFATLANHFLCLPV